MKINDINTVTMTGVISRDPGAGNTDGGVKYGYLSIMSVNSFKDREFKTLADVSTFDEVAIGVISTLKQGDRILVEGELSSRKVGDVWKTGIKARRILKLDSSGSAAQAPESEDQIPF